MKIKTKQKKDNKKLKIILTHRQKNTTHALKKHNSYVQNKQTYNWGKEFCAVLHKVDISLFLNSTLV